MPKNVPSKKRISSRVGALHKDYGPNLSPDAFLRYEAGKSPKKSKPVTLARVSIQENNNGK